MTASSPPSALVMPGTGWVRVNWDVWRVDCAWCTSTLALGPPVTVHGRVRPGLEWGQPEMICWDCGRLTGPILGWPADPEAIMALLGLRPDVRNRNWVHGETLDDLLAENAAHGILPPLPELPAGSNPLLMLTVEGLVVGGALVDLLPDADARRALGASAGAGVAIGGR
jgi:hypothetical protein